MPSRPAPFHAGLTPRSTPGNCRVMMWDGVFNGLRWLAGAGLLGLAWHWGTREQDPVNPARLLLAAASFLAALLFLWKPIFHLATRPLFALIDAIFFPGGASGKPSLNLKLPAHYLDEARYEEALAEYRKILRHYPDETEAYEKSIWLQAAVFKDPAAARALLKKAKRRRLVLDPAMVSLAETPIRS